MTDTNHYHRPFTGAPAQRLQALDAMRGITVALMILVNNQLWEAPIYAPLRHCAWNGLAIADIVFPWFMFIMGIGMAYSLRRFDYSPSRAAVSKVLRRAILIYLIGLALELLKKGLAGSTSLTNFSNVRLMGVLPRLGISYGIAALTVLWISTATVKHVIVWFLAGYAAVLLLFDGFLPSSENIVARVDLALLGESHMYHEYVPERIALDPEGLLGLIPSAAHVLIGYLAGHMIMEIRDNTDRIMRLMVYGTIMALAGFLLSDILPVNKKVWSPTFVLVSCGLGAQILGLLIWIIDVKGVRRWTPAVTVFGVNPLALYVLSGLIAITLMYVKIGGVTLPGLLLTEVLQPIFGADSVWPSTVYSLLFVLLCRAIGYPLWKRKIYLRL